MNLDKEKMSLIIKDLSTGYEKELHDFFTCSEITQGNLFDDFVLPILNNGRSVILQIVYK